MNAAAGKKPLNLWCLNRVARWDPAALRRPLSERYEVFLGQRVAQGSTEETLEGTVRVAVNREGNSAPTALMHEDPHAAAQRGYDEYFVPLPEKCVRDPGAAFWRELATTEPARARLAELAAHLEQRRAWPSSERSAQWSPGRHFAEVRLNLAEGVLGYYEVLQRATKLTGGKNVLLGYSQGGVVARYLAYLDEALAPPERRCIQGVFTLHAPNGGTPLASPAKRADVAEVLAALFTRVPLWARRRAPALQPLWDTSLHHGDPEARLLRLLETLDHLLDRAKEDGALAKHLEHWRTARKWLSGLGGVPSLAFWDLAPERLAERGSVLESIASVPLRESWHGAIVGTDNKLADLQEAALDKSFWGSLVDPVLAALFGPYEHDAGLLYSEKAMRFPPPPAGGNEVFAREADGYLHGLLTPALPNREHTSVGARAHDFLVPSVSQLLYPDAKDARHLGNKLNRLASHLSGADDTREPGTSSRELLCGMLFEMARSDA